MLADRFAAFFVSIYRYCSVIKVTKQRSTSLLEKGIARMLQRHSTFLNMIVFLVSVFVPVIGHILDTILILRDDHSKVGKALWLLIVWLFPFVGALLYMLFGHRPRPAAMINGPTYSQMPSSPIFPKPL